MNNNRRTTTVHDLTTLSLHPTGSRAQPHETNSLRDARGNWIARDAGGWGGVPKRKGVRADSVDDEEEEGEATVHTGRGIKEGKAKRAREDGEEEGHSVKDSRARRRRKLVHDVDFIPDDKRSRVARGHLNVLHNTDNIGSSSSVDFSIPSSVRPFSLSYNKLTANSPHRFRTS